MPTTSTRPTASRILSFVGLTVVVASLVGYTLVVESIRASADEVSPTGDRLEQPADGDPVGGPFADTAADTVDDASAGRHDEAPTVVVIGDSITVNATPMMEHAFDEQAWDHHVTGLNGHMLADRMAEIALAAHFEPDVVVISLGTNDEVCLLHEQLLPDGCHRHPGYSVERFHELVADAVKLFAPERTCVIGVTTVMGHHAQEAFGLHEQQGRVAGIVDWDQIAQAEPSHLADDIGHLSEQGGHAMAAAVVEMIDEVC